MKKQLAVLVGAVIFFIPVLTHASTFTTNVVTANFSPTNDQTDVSTTTITNVSQVSASRTLYIGTIPTASTTSTIGSCVVTYSSTTPDKLACTGNTAIVNFITHSTAVAIATALRSLTSVVDAVHGALSVAGSGLNTIFSTAGVETATSTISFTDGTAGAVTSTSTTNGTIPVAQVNTVTLGGTVDTGDVFHVTVPSGVVTYTTQSSDTSLTNIATGLNAALTATSSNLVFTNATSTGATILLTAKTAGTAFTQTSSAANASPTAEQVTFAPPSGVPSAAYTITINGNNYTGSDSTGSTTAISTMLAGLMGTDPAATCLATTLVTCTAKVAGVAFTYSTNIVLPTFVNAGGGSSGGGGGSAYHVLVTNPVFTTTVISPAHPIVPANPVTGTGSTSGAATITKTLHIGSRNKNVSVLQMLLGTDPTLGFTGGATGYYGVKTRTAVEAFQVKYGIVTPNTDGYGSVGPKTRAMLVTVFGS